MTARGRNRPQGLAIGWSCALFGRLKASRWMIIVHAGTCGHSRSRCIDETESGGEAGSQSSGSAVLNMIRITRILCNTA